MAAGRRSTARGPNAPDWDFRTRLGADEWGGMIPDGDPGSLPPFRPRVIFDGRLQAGAIVARGGQQGFNADPLQNATASVRYLDDFQVATKKSLMMVAVGCASFSATVGFSLGSYDFEQDPEVQSNVYYSSTGVGLFLATFGDDLYIGSDNTLRRYSAVESPFGQNGLAMSGLTQDLPLVTFAGMTQIKCMIEFDGYLFVGLDGGAGASKVSMFDGRTESDDLTAINAPLGFGLYRESLILGYGGAPNHIRVRPVGAPGTAWATVAPGAGTVRLKNGVSYKDVFYMTTGAEDVYKYDGTTLTRIPILTTGIAAASVTDGIAVLNGYLYISYTTATNHAVVAKFDGATWTAVEKDLTTQFGVTTRIAGPMREYKGSLAVGGFTTGVGGQLFVSPREDTDGVWVDKTPPQSGSTFGGQVVQLVVY